MERKRLGDVVLGIIREDWNLARKDGRALALPMLLALPSLAWVIEATRRASLETLGRDQGIFQYIAMALMRGARDYRDVRDVNGPLTHAIHMIFLVLGGADEHRFRVLDLTVTGLSFAVVGACLPGLARRKEAAPPGLLERAAWALAAWVVLSAQYLRYLFWDLAQRESFFDWFMLVSVALQVAALSPNVRARTRLVLLGVSGALSLIPWFGKPTYALFTLAELAAFAVAETEGEGWGWAERRRWLAAFGAGAVFGAATQVVFLCAYGDFGAFVRIYFVDVPSFYRFIWPRTFIDSLNPAGSSMMSAISIVASLVTLALVAEGYIPRRALAVALVPLAGLASVVAQAKGFPYHFHPVTAGLYLQGLVLVVSLGEQLGSVAEGVAASVGRLLRLLPLGVAAALGMTVVAALLESPHLQNWWIQQKGVSAELRESRDYLVYFKTSDFFPWEMRQAAAYLREHTKPEDRVQLYGMDPYLLFLARRLSATPYIYAYDLDADAALTGSSLPEGLHPSWAQAEKIRALRAEHERDFLAKIQASPPAAFVFMDHSPLISEDDDAWLDFAEHNPASVAWVEANYKQTVAFGDDCIWMRRDLAGGLGEVHRVHVHEP